MHMGGAFAWARELAEFMSCFSAPMASALAFQSMTTSAFAGRLASARLSTAAMAIDFMAISLTGSMERAGQGIVMPNAPSRVVKTQ